MPAISKAAAEAARSWPFEEARKILNRLAGKDPKKGFVLFETGYGPSGLPHIGTFGEVVRTSMVRHAFECLCDIPTKLYCFSDDMDGFRKVPTNLPNQDMLRQHLDKPLTSVPDPFGTHDSFAAHNNARLQAFLDSFGFEYEFKSSTDHYKGGVFDAALQRMAEVYEKVMAIMLPTLGQERQATYSPFLPLSPTSGKVLQVPLTAVDAAAGTVRFIDEDGQEVEQSLFGGRVKVQWKPDWAMRWFALEVDYEMAGKDLIDSVTLSGKITRALGGVPPEGFNYELFLDEQGTKISKSKGNGLAVEEWLRYAPQDSLAYYMYGKPKTAKRLYFDVIPKAVDEYVTFAAKAQEEQQDKLVDNAAWHVHRGAVPDRRLPVPFAMLLNLAAVVNAEEPGVLWGFITRYAPQAAPGADPFFDGLVANAVLYYQDRIRPEKTYRPPTQTEQAAIQELAQRLKDLAPEVHRDAEAIMTEVYATGKAHGYEQLRDWFKCLYEVLLGQSQGPRMGSFIALYGVEETLTLIDRALRGDLCATQAA